MGAKGKKKVYAGTKYYMGLHMVLCYGPVDAIIRVSADDKEVWKGTNTGGIMHINKPGLWGGESREGGIVGQVSVDMGEPFQQPNDYLRRVIGKDIPAYRDVVSLIWRRLNYGMSPYLKPWAITVKRVLTLNSGNPQWNSTKADIKGDSNPAHIIRECLTDPTWGLGYTEAQIDDVSFTATAAQLYTENFGLSFLLETETSIEAFMKEVLGHISARLFVAPSTSKFTLRLIRDDYILAELPVLDETNVIEVEEFERRTWSETTNQINVLFTDRLTAKRETVVVHDIANIQRQGAVVSTTTTYRGITNGDLALRVASRDLSILSNSLSKLRIKVNRTAFDTEAGDVFKFYWGAYGLAGIAYRVMDIDYGEALEGIITITAIEDSFGLPLNSYVRQQPPDWQPPEYPPVDAQDVKVYEANYWWVVSNIPQSDINTLDPAFSIALMAVGEPGPGQYDYDLYTRVGVADYAEVGSGSYCPSALTLTLLRRESVSTVPYDSDSGVYEDDYLLNTYAYIGDELVSITSVNKTTKELVVSRGVYDTPPLEHPVGTKILFVSGEEAVDTNEYVNNETINMKALTNTNLGTLAVASATTHTLVTDFRYQKPYAPGNFRANGTLYPTSVPVAGDDVITWSHRDRTLQTAYPVLQTESNIGPEDGTTYTLYIKNPVGEVVRTVPNLTGTTYTYALVDELADIAENKPMEFIIYEIETVANGLTSYRRNTMGFSRPVWAVGKVVAVATASSNNSASLVDVVSQIYSTALASSVNSKTIVAMTNTNQQISSTALASSGNSKTIVAITNTASQISATVLASSGSSKTIVAVNTTQQISSTVLASSVNSKTIVAMTNTASQISSTALASSVNSKTIVAMTNTAQQISSTVLASSVNSKTIVAMTNTAQPIAIAATSASNHASSAITALVSEGGPTLVPEGGSILGENLVGENGVAD